MEYITGEELLHIPRMRQISQYKKRFCYAKLKNYIQNDFSRRVMSLFGLRRTGKTVMMLQMIQELNDPARTCWISCESGDTIQDLKDVLNQNMTCKYFFIDEVTRLKDFIPCASILADKYSELYEKKIVMAGTDSLGFHLAKCDELYDRTEMIHTTYIPFSEYHALLGKDLESYVMYGGTLTDGNEFYNADACMEYTNTAIADNIQHSLDRLGRDGEYGALASFRRNEELTTFFNKIIELYNRSFTADVVNKRFKAHDISSLRQIATKRDLVADSASLDTEQNKALRQAVMQALQIKEPLLEQATDRAILEAKKFLQILDVIYPVPTSDEVIFTQPGLRYCQAVAQVEVLRNTPHLPFHADERDVLIKTLQNDIKGQMLEDILFYQLSKDASIQSHYTVSKFKSSTSNAEFDIVCTDKDDRASLIIEVKHSNQVIEQQVRHLVNSSLCEEFENTMQTKISGKAVIYKGNSLKEKPFGVSYINAEDFLCAPLRHIQALTREYQNADTMER